MLLKSTGLIPLNQNVGGLNGLNPYFIKTALEKEGKLGYRESKLDRILNWLPFF